MTEICYNRERWKTWAVRRLGKEQCMGKLLITVGVLCIIIGALIELGSGFLPLGHLPGDIKITGSHGSFYFPVVTCIVISIVLNIVLSLFH